MDTTDLVAGFTELARYGCGTVTGNSEGAICLSPTETPCTPASVAKLRTLGWAQRTTHYDPREPWFTVLPKEAGRA